MWKSRKMVGDEGSVKSSKTGLEMRGSVEVKEDGWEVRKSRRMVGR